MARAEGSDQPVPLASLVMPAIRSEVGPPLETVEQEQLLVLVELEQLRSIRCVEPDVPTQKCAWLVKSLV